MESSGLRGTEFDEKGPDVDSIKHEFSEQGQTCHFGWIRRRCEEIRFNEWAGKG